MLRAARRPPRVAGLLFILTMNPRVSSLTFHLTQSALSSVKKSFFFIPSFLRSSGTTLSRSTSLLVNFLN